VLYKRGVKRFATTSPIVCVLACHHHKLTSTSSDLILIHLETSQKQLLENGDAFTNNY